MKPIMEEGATEGEGARTGCGRGWEREEGRDVLRR